MQRTIISMAVRHACLQIGQEWQQRQHIAQMAEAVARGKDEKDAK